MLGPGAGAGASPREGARHVQVGGLAPEHRWLLSPALSAGAMHLLGAGALMICR